MVAFAKEEQKNTQSFSGFLSDICWLVFVQEKPFFFDRLITIFSTRELAEYFAFHNIDCTYSTRSMTWREVVEKYGGKYDGVTLDCTGLHGGHGKRFVFKFK